jgi:hypothetical protein
MSKKISLEFVQEQTPELCLEDIRINPFAIEYIKEQTPEICLEAVKQNGETLQYVKEQTPEICLAAVKDFGYALQYVKEQTPEICLEAVKQYEESIKYIKEQTPELCLIAYDQNPYIAIKYIKPEILQQIYHIILNDTIEPSEFINFPEGINATDFTDPITLDELIKGEIYGFLIEGIKMYLVGSLNNINIMIKNKFRKSTTRNIFVPYKNELVHVSKIKWVRI